LTLALVPRKYVEVWSTDSVLVSSVRVLDEKSLFKNRNSNSFYITSPSVVLTVAQKTTSSQSVNRCSLLKSNEKAICSRWFCLTLVMGDRLLFHYTEITLILMRGFALNWDF
jgi:hypothetical protein